MPAFSGEDVMMGQFWEISTANLDREWTRMYANRRVRWVEDTRGDVLGSRLLAIR
jgi:hypothetical protein